MCAYTSCTIICWFAMFILYSVAPLPLPSIHNAIHDT